MRLLDRGNPSLAVLLVSLPFLLAACGGVVPKEELAAVQGELQAAQSRLQELEQQLVALDEKNSENQKQGVTEIFEDSIFRGAYNPAPFIGAKGYVVGKWDKGRVRVEVKDFPSSQTGYEVFLFETDVDAWGAKRLEIRNRRGFDLPPSDEVLGLITQWHSLGDLGMDDNGNGVLEYYRGGQDLYSKGFNMMMVFEKVTPGRHGRPEDFTKLIVFSNGSLAGTMWTEGKGSARP